MAIIVVSIGQEEIEEAISNYLYDKLSKTMDVEKPLKVNLTIHNSYSDPRGDSSPGSVDASVTIQL
jgi:hypothetical protein